MRVVEGVSGTVYKKKNSESWITDIKISFFQRFTKERQVECSF